MARKVAVVDVRVASDDAPSLQRELSVYRLSTEFLGGSKVFKTRLCSRSDVHSAILQGVPYSSLLFFISRFTSLHESDAVNVLGISARTLRRQKDAPKKPMPADLASKTWLFAETLAKASEVLGGKDRAEEWMSKPATGLDGQRPVDLLQTVQGAEIVDDFLTRLEHGVYS